jgi:hypothetical protein
MAPLASTPAATETASSSASTNGVSRSTPKTKPALSEKAKRHNIVKRMLKQCPNDVKLVHRATNKEISLFNGAEVHCSDEDIDDLRTDFIPKPLQPRVKEGTHVIYAIELWVIGVLANINSIVIYPSGFDKPFSLKVGRASAQTLNRFWEARFTRAVCDSHEGEVMFRPNLKGDPVYKGRKMQQFGTIICFNDSLGLNNKTKFDLCVDKDNWVYRLKPYIYKRDFIGTLPTRDDGSKIDVAIGVGRDWYDLDLKNPSGTDKVKLIGHRDMGFTTSGQTVETYSISVNDNMKCDLRTFHRQEPCIRSRHDLGWPVHSRTWSSYR